eukprot:6182262-Pleurochrysis_carterae.AAC.4
MTPRLWRERRSACGSRVTAPPPPRRRLKAAAAPVRGSESPDVPFPSPGWRQTAQAPSAFDAGCAQPVTHVSPRSPWVHSAIFFKG